MASFAAWRRRTWRCTGHSLSSTPSLRSGGNRQDQAVCVLIIRFSSAAFRLPRSRAPLPRVRASLRHRSDRSSSWPLHRSQHQRVIHFELGSLRKQMIVDPASEDRRLHRHHPGLRQRFIHLSSSRQVGPILLPAARGHSPPSRSSRSSSCVRPVRSSSYS
jgi:hypothetical protein